MRVGIPREVKDHEYRVAITPAGVHELTRAGHQVYVEKDAGLGSSLPDDDFVAAGATILADPDDVWDVDLVLKVKAGTYLIEAANPRHEHEWRIWESVKLPEGKVLAPAKTIAGTWSGSSSSPPRSASAC